MDHVVPLHHVVIAGLIDGDRIGALTAERARYVLSLAGLKRPKASVGTRRLPPATTLGLPRATRSSSGPWADGDRRRRSTPGPETCSRTSPDGHKLVDLVVVLLPRPWRVVAARGSARAHGDAILVLKVRDLVLLDGERLEDHLGSPRMNGMYFLIAVARLQVLVRTGISRFQQMASWPNSNVSPSVTRTVARGGSIPVAQVAWPAITTARVTAGTLMVPPSG